MPKKEILLQINNEKELNKICERIVDRLFNNGGVERQGHYGLSRTQATIAIKEAILNNEDPLPELDTLTYLSWNYYEKKHFSITQHDVDMWNKALNHNNFWNIDVLFTRNEIQSIDEFVEESLAVIKEVNEYPQRRKQASIYTSNRKVRERILSKYNHKCVECGSKKDLTIDHIIPVLLGGNNSDENLQVLCRSCNSCKGCKKGKRK